MKEKQLRRPRPYKTVYRTNKLEWYGHSCTLKGAARAAFPKILANKGVTATIYSENEVLLVAMLWQNRKGIWVAVHAKLDSHFMEVPNDARQSGAAKA